MTLKKVPLSITLLFLILKAYAQDVPLGALAAPYNGGFAGEAGALRLPSFSYLKYFRYDSPAGLQSSSHTGTFISVDHFLKKLRSGVAITSGLQGDSRYYKDVAMSV